jgi:hypothetical protein
MKKIFLLVLFAMSTGCMTVVMPPTYSPLPGEPVPQHINQLRQRVDVSVTNNCDLYLDVVYEDTVRARLAPSQSVTIYVQRHITEASYKGMVMVKSYESPLKHSYLGSAYREYYFPTNPQDSWKVQRETWVVDQLYSPYGYRGGCHYRQAP